ncbi:hypothetical protein Tco_0135943 [Tanacetum coccineum]
MTRSSGRWCGLTSTAAEIQAVEKERKAKNILLMAIPKERMRRFHGMDDAKEIWEAIRIRFGGNANSKKMQKAVFKQQFKAFTISSSEGLEKGYDRFQQLLSQLEAHGAKVSTEDANHKFLRFGGNANSKKMQKAVLKQQFEAFTISSSEGLEKGYDRFQQLLSQLEAHGAEISTKDANHKFLRSLPPAWSNLAMTMRTKLSHPQTGRGRNTCPEA